MKKLKPILIMTLVSAFAVLTVVNMSLASPKSGGENTLDMLEIMTRAFDESEGGIGFCPYASWDDMFSDMTNNMCLGGEYDCNLNWKKDGITVATYYYILWTSSIADIFLVCGEGIVIPPA